MMKEDFYRKIKQNVEGKQRTRINSISKFNSMSPSPRIKNHYRSNESQLFINDCLKNSIDLGGDTLREEDLFRDYITNSVMINQPSEETLGNYKFKPTLFRNSIIADSQTSMLNISGYILSRDNSNERMKPIAEVKPSHQTSARKEKKTARLLKSKAEIGDLNMLINDLSISKKKIFASKVGLHSTKNDHVRLPKISLLNQIPIKGKQSSPLKRSGHQTKRSISVMTQDVSGMEFLPLIHWN